MTHIHDSRFPDNSNLNFDAALTDASINARIEYLSHYQKVMLIHLLEDGRVDLRYTTYNALEKMGFVRDRLTPDYYKWDELTAEGIIAALRLLSPEYKDGSLFYHLSKERTVREHARQRRRENARRWAEQMAQWAANARNFDEWAQSRPASDESGVR